MQCGVEVGKQTPSSTLMKLNLRLIPSLREVAHKCAKTRPR